jgi:hypothetical protein
MRRFKVPVTVAADGSATAYTPRVAGLLNSIHYVKTDFADGVDFTITSEATGETLWAEMNINASTVRNPRAATHTYAGVAALYAAAGTAVQDKIALASDRIKIVIAAGGVSKTGTFHFLID